MREGAGVEGERGTERGRQADIWRERGRERERKGGRNRKMRIKILKLKENEQMKEK